MDSIKSKKKLRDIPKLKESSQNFLMEFDKFVLKLNMDAAENEAVKNFRSYLEVHSEKLNEHIKILSTISHISSLFSSHSNLSEILSHIVQSVREVFNFTRVIILLLNEDKSLLECKIISGMTEKSILYAQAKPLILNKHDCIETKVARFGDTYFIENINDPRLTEIDRKIIKGFKRGSTIYVPIISKNGIIGVLGVDRQSSLPLMKLEDVSRIQLYANNIGGLIDNAKLYESLIRHKNRFENIIKKSPNGIIITDKHGDINLINNTAEKLLAVTSSQSLGLPVEKLLGSKILGHVKFARSKWDQMESFDITLENPIRGKLILSVSVLDMKYENKTEIIIIFQDITQKKMIGAHIQRLDKLASIGTMASGIAHEIRSPLTSISMDLDSLYDTACNNEEVQKTIPLVLNEIERIDKIVSNLLQFSRLSKKKLFPFKIVHIIKESCLLAQKKIGKKKIQIVTELELESLEITGNPERIKQMIVNLIINAIQAIKVEGTIIIRAELLKENDSHRDGILKKSCSDKYKDVVKITIEDTGEGIPLKFINKIFDPYFTTKNSGTGLGLSIASKVAEEHQGYISVSRRSDKGTMFKVFIPTNLNAG